MYKVYVLYSRKHGKTYTGYTSSLTGRLKSHNFSGKKDWTTRYRPWILIHIEFYQNKSEAMKREKELKSGQGRKFIKEEILPSIMKS